MIRKVIDYVKEDNFELRFDNNYISVINYSTVNYMEDEKISIEYKDGKILIKGKKLVVSKLLDNEILIKGNFNTIEIGRKYE